MFRTGSAGVIFPAVVTVVFLSQAVLLSTEHDVTEASPLAAISYNQAETGGASV
jgi:hypothetical protein